MKTYSKSFFEDITVRYEIINSELELGYVSNHIQQVNKKIKRNLRILRFLSYIIDFFASRLTFFCYLIGFSIFTTLLISGYLHEQKTFCHNEASNTIYLLHPFFEFIMTLTLALLVSQNFRKHAALILVDGLNILYPGFKNIYNNAIGKDIIEIRKVWLNDRKKHLKLNKRHSANRFKKLKEIKFGKRYTKNDLLLIKSAIRLRIKIFVRKFYKLRRLKKIICLNKINFAFKLFDDVAGSEMILNSFRMNLNYFKIIKQHHEKIYIYYYKKKSYFRY